MMKEVKTDLIGCQEMKKIGGIRFAAIRAISHPPEIQNIQTTVLTTLS